MLNPILIQVLVLKATTEDPKAKELKGAKDGSAEGGKSTPCVLRGCRATVICCSSLEDDCTPS